MCTWDKCSTCVTSLHERDFTEILVLLSLCLSSIICLRIRTVFIQNASVCVVLRQNYRLTTQSLPNLRHDWLYIKTTFPCFPFSRFPFLCFQRPRKVMEKHHYVLLTNPKIPTRFITHCLVASCPTSSNGSRHAKKARGSIRSAVSTQCTSVTNMRTDRQLP